MSVRTYACICVLNLTSVCVTAHFFFHIDPSIPWAKQPSFKKMEKPSTEKDDRHPSSLPISSPIPGTSATPATYRDTSHPPQKVATYWPNFAKQKPPASGVRISAAISVSFRWKMSPLPVGSSTSGTARRKRTCQFSMRMLRASSLLLAPCCLAIGCLETPDRLVDLGWAWRAAPMV